MNCILSGRAWMASIYKIESILGLMKLVAQREKHTEQTGVYLHL